MRRFSRYGWWYAALMTMILLAVASRPRRDALAPSARPFADWSIVELVEYLNRVGVDVRLRSTQENGPTLQTAFLTIFDKDWHTLNHLTKNAKRIREWCGVLYCERRGQSESRAGLHLYGDRYRIVGPFFFYGDAELLRRVGAALAPLAPHPECRARAPFTGTIAA